MMARRSMFVKLRLPVREELYVHKARNVTAEGLCIDDPMPLAQGACVQIEFRTRKDTGITCDTEVAQNTDMVGQSSRAPHPGFGLVFVGLGETQRRPLSEIVEG
jgi:hypothetical protein